MKSEHRVFLVAGEVSGDRIASWYLEKIRSKHDRVTAEAVGGFFLEAAGAKLYRSNADLNLVGIIEIISHLRRILRCMNEIACYILANSFDEVVLVDFPGFNMRLAKILKKKAPALNITYVSPPQMWAWGAWRITSLARFSNTIVVIYPFEVEWYKKRGVSVLFCGYPSYEEFASYATRSALSVVSTKKKYVALIAGSRMSEVKNLFPAYATVARAMLEVEADIMFIIPRAESFSRAFLQEVIASSGLDSTRVIIAEGDTKYSLLSQCVLALSKPGTITLQLALLGVPTVIAFKISRLTYYIARPLVKVKYMGLTNLLLHKEVSPEFIQSNFSSEAIIQKALSIYRSYSISDESYVGLVEDHLSVHSAFRTP